MKLQFFKIHAARSVEAAPPHIDGYKLRLCPAIYYTVNVF